MGGRAEPVAAVAVEHAARMVERRQSRWVAVASTIAVATSASVISIGLPGIPIALTAFAIAGRAIGRRRWARDIARAAAGNERTWSLVGQTVIGRAESARDVELALPSGVVRTLRALPAARVVSRVQTASSTPPATER